MAQLKFHKDENEQPTKEAMGMWSKDGEYVDFDKPCICAGQVETWLNRLVAMHVCNKEGKSVDLISHVYILYIMCIHR